VLERRLWLWGAGWIVGQEESRVGLGMVSWETAHAESLSTMSMGVAHFGQRKQAGWMRAECSSPSFAKQVFSAIVRLLHFPLALAPNRTLAVSHSPFKPLPCSLFDR
jgi:hypothetical protein